MEKLKDSLEIICPRCHKQLGTGVNISEACAHCGTTFPQLHGVPILRPVGTSERIDYRDKTEGLPIQNSTTLPIPFIQEALSSNGLVLELGAGIDICAADNLIKTDAYLYSTDLDYVADGHCLPFPANTFDYIYSLAVFEHIHSPWVVAEEIFRVLKPGGKVYTLTAFNQHLHGYPSHFFNMTEMGLRRVFAKFEIIECGPSRFCPLEQIAFSLADFTEMVIHLKRQRQSRHQSLAQVDVLETVLVKATELIPVLQSELIKVPEAYEAWRKIAPGLDLIARKPESGLTLNQPIQPAISSEAKYDLLEHEITALNSQLKVSEIKGRAIAQQFEPVELDFEALAELDLKQRRIVARQKSAGHYFRVFSRDLKERGLYQTLKRSFNWLKWIFLAESR